MPRITAAQIVSTVLDAINDSGASGVLISTNGVNPRQFVIQSGSNVINVWVYIWTLTHGGGSARPEDEFRIQLTGISSPLRLNPSGSTVLLGYEPNLGCFAGFDISKHLVFTGRSPSIQIPITILHTAQQDGFSFFTKGNDEIAIGFRSSEFLSYVINSTELHILGADSQMVDLLTRAASLVEIPSIDLSQVTRERQRVITTVERLARDTGFRRKVTIAYDHRCAVTRMQLRLVDAAHILPVGAPDSNDETYNGICLTPTYHRAYDRSLIYLDEDFVMHINPKKERELIALGFGGGIQDFKSYLGRRVHLPADRKQWPNADLIRQANKFRNIN